MYWLGPPKNIIKSSGLLILSGLHPDGKFLTTDYRVPYTPLVRDF